MAKTMVDREMERLADGFRTILVWAFWLILLLGAMGGLGYGIEGEGGVSQGAIGAIIGLLVAAVVGILIFGAFATLSDMRSELRSIREVLEKSG